MMASAAEAAASSARDRYVPEQQPPDGHGRRPWAVRDTETKALLLVGDEVDVYPFRDGAERAATRQRYLDELGGSAR
jgi:hypothetical protein